MGYNLAMAVRKALRTTLKTPLLVTVGDQQLQGEVIDIGLLGIACFLPAVPEMDRPLMTEFKLGKITLRTWMAPIWGHAVDGGRFRVGLEFRDLDSKHHQQIADYISETWLRENNYT